MLINVALYSLGVLLTCYPLCKQFVRIGWLENVPFADGKNWFSGWHRQIQRRYSLVGLTTMLDRVGLRITNQATMQSGGVPT